MEIKEVQQKPPVDNWVCQPEDAIFTNTKGIIFAPVINVLGLSEQWQALNCFIMSSKKCYNSQIMRDHTCHYLNYFEKYYDTDKELLIIMSRIKYLIDSVQAFTKMDLIYQIKTYIISDNLRKKAWQMVEDNYTLDLEYKNISENLQYTDQHAKIMLCMSLFMNMVIPLITHFAYQKKEGVIDEFIMEVFDQILYMYPGIDIYSKLYETTISNVSKNEAKNAALWAKQDIRGKDPVTHSNASVNNIILNIMPKYAFDKSIISLNFTSITKNTNCQVLEIEYEYNYIPLSSSKRDEDNVSDFDKYESNLIKQDESLFIQSKMNCEETMSRIDTIYGPFDQWEIDFFKQRLKNEKGVIINGFQKQMIFNMFYKDFLDTESAKGVNADEYIKLMLASRKILQTNQMIILPYILSGKVEKLIGRKSVNKKEMQKLQASSYYPQIVAKYHNDKIVKNILSMIATIISSDFTIIDYHNKQIDGQKINTIPDIVIEEVLAYTLLI